MKVDRPGPGEELNESGTVTPARQAATVILLRGGAERLEVLLVQRNPKSKFMGGAWVFPGGAVDTAEGEGDAAHRLAAIRETEEEAGITVPGGPDSLVKFSRWITPAVVKIRFDTHFFLAEAPEGVEARCDGQECVDVRWFTPTGALEAYSADELLLVFPTIKHLEQLAPFGNVHELLEWARERERDVVAVEPQIVQEGDVARVVLPGEPGYVG